jgi:hypothetical protein
MKVTRCCKCGTIELHGRQRCQGKLIKKDKETGKEIWTHCLHWLKVGQCCRRRIAKMHPVYEYCQDCETRWVSYRLGIHVREELKAGSQYFKAKYRLCGDCTAARFQPVPEEPRWVAPWVVH